MPHQGCSNYVENKIVQVYSLYAAFRRDLVYSKQSTEGQFSIQCN